MCASDVEVDLPQFGVNIRAAAQAGKVSPWSRFKRADVPKVTRSMRIEVDDLKLDALYVV